MGLFDQIASEMYLVACAAAHWKRAETVVQH